jgi:hypothetical protein
MADCSRYRSQAVKFIILHSFLSQKSGMKQGVFPREKPVIPESLCRNVTPKQGCFTLFYTGIHQTLKIVQRNAI